MAAMPWIASTAIFVFEGIVESKLLDEGLIALDDVLKMMTPPPSRCTLFRWARQGVHGVKLETVCVGLKRFTSRQAFARFLESTTRARTTT
jgi:hypothetical protein